MKITVPVLCVLALAPASVFAQEIAENVPDAAAKLAPKITTALRDTNPSGRMLAAVLPFGDQNGQVTAALGVLPRQIQGQLIEELSVSLVSAGLPHIKLFDVDALDSHLDAKSGTLASVSIRDPATARQKLNAVGLQVGILGSISKFDNKTALIRVLVLLPATEFTIQVEVAGWTLEDDVLDDSIVPPIPSNDGPGSATARRRVTISFEGLSRSSNRWVPLPLERPKNGTGPYRTALILRVNRREFANQPYRIIAANHGIPQTRLSLGWTPGNDDKDRVFATAVYVDGVSTFKRNKGTGGVRKWKRDIRHPAYVSKNILTAPGRKFLPKSGGDERRFDEGMLDNASGDGHSRWTIKGFQIGSRFAEQFVFGSASNSIAAGLSQNVSQVGLISAFVYAEKLKSDNRGRIFENKGIGTEPKAEVPSPIFQVKVKDWHPEPVDVWHVLYRYDDDPNCPPEDECEPYLPFTP